MTDNHGYNTPDQGTGNWHIPLNENFEALDADVEVRDVSSNLDQYTPSEGAKFLATDTGTVYLGNGSSWQNIGTIAQGAGNPDTIIAETAGEIQPAIDALSERFMDGNIHAGHVQLLAKAYYPTDTIFMKRGVTLRGARHAPQSVTTGPTDDTQQTTIYSRDMPEGRGSPYPSEGANTWGHFDSHDDLEAFFGTYSSLPTASVAWEYIHPHLSVINGFDRYPFLERIRDRTDYENAHKGDGAGLMNLRIQADKKRWWDPSGENDTDPGSDGLTDFERATYFGVYDGMLWENTNQIRIEDVEVTGFLGYNGFYIDTRDVISRGNVYSGTATDHHGASLQLSTNSQDPTPYVTGMWDLRVAGPTPTVGLAGHIRTKFRASNWSVSKITGRDTVFLGSEADYDAGMAPMADPTFKHACIAQTNQHPRWSGYEVEARNTNDPKIGVVARDNRIAMEEMLFRDLAVGIDGNGQRAMVISDSRFQTDVGQVVDNWQGTWNNVVFTGDGIDFSQSANSNIEGGYEHVVFQGQVGIRGASNGPAVFYNPSFASCDIPIEDPAAWRDGDGTLLLANPVGYNNEGAGTASASADGSTTYLIPHGLDETPEWANVDPATPDAIGDFAVTADATDIIIDYLSAPSGDLEWQWAAKGWSAPGVAQIS